MPFSSHAGIDLGPQHAASTDDDGWVHLHNFWIKDSNIYTAVK